MQNADTTKYIIHTKISADGVIERPDIVGAIFGQTEGLLGTDLDLRELQKTGRIGRIEVMATTKGGKTRGNIFIPSSLDKIKTAVLAASLETIDRVGPCTATIEVTKVEDVRAVKRANIIERAKVIYTTLFDDDLLESQEIADVVRESVRIEDITFFGKNRLPAGPEHMGDDIIIVEGRADVLNLLKYGIKNTVSVGGTNIPPEVAELTKGKTVTVFTDGDRGGELIIRELMQVAKVDFVARPPDGKAVEDLVQKEIVLSLRRKMPADQYAEKCNIPIKKPKHDDRGERKSIAADLISRRVPKRVEKIRRDDSEQERTSGEPFHEPDVVFTESPENGESPKKPVTRRLFVKRAPGADRSAAVNETPIRSERPDRIEKSDRFDKDNSFDERTEKDDRIVSTISGQERPFPERPTAIGHVRMAKPREVNESDGLQTAHRGITRSVVSMRDRDERRECESRFDSESDADEREYKGKTGACSYHADRIDGSNDSDYSDDFVRSGSGKSGRSSKYGASDASDVSFGNGLAEETVANVKSAKSGNSFFEEQIKELSGTLSARLFGDGNKMIREIRVRDLASTLKNGVENVRAIVFDGVVTQRLVDIAEEQRVSDIVGLKQGSIVKRPAGLKITVFQ